MKTSKFTEEQIAFALHQADMGTRRKESDIKSLTAKSRLQLVQKVCGSWCVRAALLED